MTHAPKPRAQPRRMSLLACYLLLCSAAHAEYDFSNPAYAVKNTPDHDSQQLEAAMERQRSNAARAEAEYRAAQLRENSQRYEWIVITRDGQRIPFDDYVRDHPTYSRSHGYSGNDGARVSDGSDRVNSSGSANQSLADTPGITPLDGTRPNDLPSAPPPRVGSSWIHILSVFLLMGVIGFLLYRRFFIPLLAPTPLRAARPTAAAQPASRPAAPRPVTPRPAAQAGTVALAAAPVAEPRRSAPTIDFVRTNATPAAATLPAAPAPATQSIAVDPNVAPIWRSGNQPSLEGVHANNHVHRLVDARLQAFAADSLDALAPMQYGAVLKQANLDYSAASLARVDAFLRQLRDKTQPQYQDYVDSPEKRHLVQFLGFYIATTIARLTSQSIRWYTLDGLKERAADPHLPDDLEHSYGCVYGDGNLSLPLALVCNALFSPDATQATDVLAEERSRQSAALNPMLMHGFLEGANRMQRSLPDQPWSKYLKAD